MELVSKCPGKGAFRSWWQVSPLLKNIHVISLVGFSGTSPPLECV